ncbi:MAG: hypothetical protein R8K20_06365 [Gallionellaceae bacterium]
MNGQFRHGSQEDAIHSPQQLAFFASPTLIADAIAIALASVETRNLKRVSADHHELDALEAEGLIQVEWLR